MSCISIIIGFEYVKGTLDYLSFVEKDIEMMIDMVKRVSTKTIVITDVVNFYTPESNTYVYKVFKREDLDTILSQLGINEEPRIIVYYTGHGEEQGIKMPNKTIYPFIEFRDVVTSGCTDANEILFILDCCHSGSLLLPYRFTDKGVFKLENIDAVALPNIICISSSESTQKSMAVEVGSFFTRNLVKAINGGVKSMMTLSKMMMSRSISDGTREEQTMCIYSSYPINPVLWTWVTNKNINIYINDAMKCLVTEVFV